MMQIHDVIQKSEAWFELRRKYPLTASDALAIATGGKGLETIVWTKLSELYSSGESEHFSTKDTERGTDAEPQARALYELQTGNTVVEVGFVTNDGISPVGGVSPDGFVGEEGLWEGKSFADAKHFRMIVEGIDIENKYLCQMQMQMLFTGRKWCDFCAYNPNFSKSLLIQRVEADEEKQKAIIEGLQKGEEIIKTIKEKI